MGDVIQFKPHDPDPIPADVEGSEAEREAVWMQFFVEDQLNTLSGYLHDVLSEDPDDIDVFLAQIKQIKEAVTKWPG